jgi:hypothetical protein
MRIEGERHEQEESLFHFGKHNGAARTPHDCRPNESTEIPFHSCGPEGGSNGKRYAVSRRQQQREREKESRLNGLGFSLLSLSDARVHVNIVYLR